MECFSPPTQSRPDCCASRWRPRRRPALRARSQQRRGEQRGQRAQRAGVYAPHKPLLILLAPAHSELARAGEAAGLPVRYEVFADRAYLDDGQLMPRSRPGAVLHDAEQCVEHVLAMLREQAIVAASGHRLPTRVDSICVHGDGPDAVRTASTFAPGTAPRRTRETSSRLARSFGASRIVRSFKHSRRCIQQMKTPPSSRTASRQGYCERHVQTHHSYQHTWLPRRTPS